MIAEKKNNWQTIESYIQKSLNMRLVEEILKPAIELRRSGKVSAVLLLTNNLIETYIDCVEYYIARHLNILPESVFDYAMRRDDPMRAPSSNPPKSLMDIENMLIKLKKPVIDLEKRTFMFDDSNYHVIKQNLAYKGYPRHYIQVIGPASFYLYPYGYINKGFLAGNQDLTDYNLVLKAMSEEVEVEEIIPSILSCANEIMVL
jgi:hypothetical protein